VYIVDYILLYIIIIYFYIIDLRYLLLYGWTGCTVDDPEHDPSRSAETKIVVYVRSSFTYHPKIVRAVQNHRDRDWDAVGVPELEVGGGGLLNSPSCTPHAHRHHPGIFLGPFGSELDLS
jgi:hypothetical protein